MILDNSHEGFISHIEGTILTALASKCETGCIVNIGCFKGKSLHFILAGNPKVKVIGIDIDLKPECDVLKHNVRLIQMDSGRVPSNVVTDPVELLFIDGDHSFDGLRRDIECWYPRVMSGGVIIIHDFFKMVNLHHQHEVQESGMLNMICRYADEFVMDRFLVNSFIHQVDTMLIVQKR